jgi:RimJ/RimL family protein N-acetyltransferase
VPDARAALAWPLTTDRLVLRPAQVEDLPALWRYRRLPEVARWLPSSPVDEAAFVARLGRPENLGPTLVAELDGRVVGDLLLRVRDGWAQAEVAADAERIEAEIGWAFAPEVRGRGLATEAVRRLLGACFTELGLRRVTAVCFADNVPSWRLMERVGMRREGASRADALHRDGRWLDSYAYAMLREEWRPA